MDKLSTLWQGANYQDNLLQAYRNFHLTIQSILIAVGAGLSVATLSFDQRFKVYCCYGILTIITGLGIYLLIKMHKLIKARGEDVDYYHNQIIELEREFPKDQQVMTAFKVYQKFSRTKTNLNEYFSNFKISDEIRSQLTEKGKGHTRLLLDKHLFLGFFIVWLSFHFITIWTIINTII